MAAAPANDIIDLRAIVRKLLAKWWWFVITCGLAGAVGVAYLKTTPKSYRVEAKMLMGEGSRTGFGQKEDFLKGMSLVRGNSQLEDDIAVLTSRNMVVRTLRKLDFGISYYTTRQFLTQEHHEFPPFRVFLDSVAVQVTGVPIHVRVDRTAGTYTVSAKGENVLLYNVQKQELLEQYIEEYNVDQTLRIGEPFVGPNLSFRIEFPEDREYQADTDYYFKINSLEAQVMNYGTRLGVSEPEGNGHVITLSMTGSTPSKEIAFINTLMETFIEAELRKQHQKGLRTIEFIDEQIGSVADSLRRAESEMEGARSTTGVFNVAATSDALFQERNRLENERNSVQRRRAYCNQVLEKIRSQSDLRNVPAPSSSGIDDPVLNNLVIEITRLSADLAAQNVSSGPKNNPTVIAMERKVKNLTASLAQTAESLVQQADIDYDQLSSRLSSINFQLGQIPKGERELGIKQRKLDLSGGLYNYLMEKKAEAGIAIASDQVDKSVVDEARVAGGGAVGPDKKVVLGGAMLLGLMIPVLIIVLRDFFNDRIADLDELKRVTSLPVLAVIPSSKRRRVTADEPKSLLAESFRTARINLQYLNANVPRQVIGFTSSTSGEGKTFSAVNLATVMALSGRRVLVIDADMRRPSVMKTLEQAEGAGLSTWLIGEAGVNDIVRRTDVPGLDVIGAGPIPPNPGELLESPRFGELISAMRSRYDHILVDSSPIGLVSEFVVLMGHLDLTLYVVRERRTQRSALRVINEMAASGKVGRVDVLLNDVKAGSSDGYGYYTK
ncbi:MAG: polysaccharide biosynthesis tyrosine autokinase [Flavobacteriales bacterium]|jgi:capsular exopolysaccharide synthesis family protein|nr:MAG: polysaccharide biosynthesis tyrosine autokinase [Flavobacteriales bacterium]